jgi:hypothetical protein
VTAFFVLFLRRIEAQKKKELHNWSLADVLSDIEAMPLAKEGFRSAIFTAVKENAIDGKILCGFEVCMYL